MDEPAEVLGGPAVGGAAGLRVMLGEHLGAVALAFGDRADVEASVEELGGSELPEGKDGPVEIVASADRRFSAGDRVIARRPPRDLHPPGKRHAYVRNGATGTIVALHRGHEPERDVVTVTFDGIGEIGLPRSFFDDVPRQTERADIGLDHAYAVTSYAVQGSTGSVSTSRIDERSQRSEAYVDITRGVDANHLYLTRAADPLDGERLPRVPPPAVDEAVADRLRLSTGEITAWEIRQVAADRRTRRSGAGVTL